MHVTQFVDVADVHLLLVDLWLVEVLRRYKINTINALQCLCTDLKIGCQRLKEGGASWSVTVYCTRKHCFQVNRNKSHYHHDAGLTRRLTVQPIFLFSVSSPFMQSLEKRKPRTLQWKTLLITSWDSASPAVQTTFSFHLGLLTTMQKQEELFSRWKNWSKMLL